MDSNSRADASTFGQSFTCGNIRVQWDELDEGHCGDYDPDDPDDVELLRFTVYRFDGDDAMAAHAAQDPQFAFLLSADGHGWQPYDDGSYCTNVPVDTPPEVRQRILEGLMGELHDPVEVEASIKKLAERLSRIDESWYPPHLQHQPAVL